MTLAKTDQRKRRRLQQLVGLRRWLEENLKYMDDARKRATRSGGWKRYWREGARKIKKHLTTVKALEREAQSNAQADRSEAAKT